MDQALADSMLKQEIEGVFVDKTKSVDLSQPNSLAAMITAASNMAAQSEGVATPEMTTEELLNLYGSTEDERVTSLLGMSSEYVRESIGYNVSFEDVSLAKEAYVGQKDSYDEIYKIISLRNKSREIENEKSL